MNILFIAPYLPSLIRVRPYHFLRQLCRHHRVTLLATDSPRALAEVSPLREICEEVHLLPLRRSVAVRRCSAGLLRGDPLWARYCSSTELESRLSSLLGSRDFDIVHVEHLRASHLALRFPGSLPAVYDSVDCISLLMERTLHGSHSLIQRAIAALELARTRAWESRALRWFDRVTVTSSEDRAALLALAPGAPVEVIPNGVDLDYFHPTGGEPEPATIVFSGKMSYHANATAALHFARRVFPLVRRHLPEARLRLVGSGPPMAVRSLASDPAVEVTGYVPDIRLPLARATLAVCPVTVRVGIQNKLLEAMAMGLPVVSSAAGASGLDAVPGRDLLVSSSPEEMAEAVCAVLSDPALRDRLSEAGRRYVEENHRWEDASARLESLYHQAFRSRTGDGLPPTGMVAPSLLRGDGKTAAPSQRSDRS